MLRLHGIATMKMMAGWGNPGLNENREPHSQNSDFVKCERWDNNAEKMCNELS